MDFEFTDLWRREQVSWTEFFSLDLGATTVSWTATAYAEFDLNTGNNTVTATTR